MDRVQTTGACRENKRGKARHLFVMAGVLTIGFAAGLGSSWVSAVAGAAQKATTAPAVGPALDRPGPAPSGVTGGEQVVDHKAEHERAIARHDNEPVDGRRSVGLAAALGRELKGIKDAGGFRVVSLDCRTETCVATIEWSNHALAIQNWAPVLNHHYPPGCGVDMALDAPSTANAPFQTRVVFDCPKGLDRSQPSSG